MVSTFAGQVIVGGVVSRTVTVNEHEFVLPAALRAVQVTRVVPIGNPLPLGCVHVMIGLGVSLAVALTL